MPMHDVQGPAGGIPVEDTGEEALRAMVGKVVSVFCPNGHAFKVRRNSADGSFFLGCSEYPSCRETEELPLALVAKLEGRPMLPGFEE